MHILLFVSLMISSQIIRGRGVEKPIILNNVLTKDIIYLYNLGEMFIYRKSPSMKDGLIAEMRIKCEANYFASDLGEPPTRWSSSSS